jgi:hypothetical protein
MLETLRKQLLVYRAALMRLRGSIRESLRYHGLITRAILVRDSAKASRLARRLVVMSGARLARAVNQPVGRASDAPPQIRGRSPVEARYERTDQPPAGGQHRPVRTERTRSRRRPIAQGPADRGPVMPRGRVVT